MRILSAVVAAIGALMFLPGMFLLLSNPISLTPLGLAICGAVLFGSALVALTVLEVSTQRAPSRAPAGQ